MMGCDIHAVFQASKDGRWEDVESNYNEERHYFLFAWLANVRNGFGFAGVPTHEPIHPIAHPRGLPADFAGGEDHPTNGIKPRFPSEDGTKWMGDHSYSWLTALEILAAPRPVVDRAGVISIKQFQEWDGISQPKVWSGDVAGAGIVVAESPRDIQAWTTHIRVRWPMPADELDYFIDEVKRLHDVHGDVRMVFGFDS